MYIFHTIFPFAFLVIQLAVLALDVGLGFLRLLLGCLCQDDRGLGQRGLWLLRVSATLRGLGDAAPLGLAVGGNVISCHVPSTGLRVLLLGWGSWLG